MSNALGHTFIETNALFCRLEHKLLVLLVATMLLLFSSGTAQSSSCMATIISKYNIADYSRASMLRCVPSWDRSTLTKRCMCDIS